MSSGQAGENHGTIHVEPCHAPTISLANVVSYNLPAPQRRLGTVERPLSEARIDSISGISTSSPYAQRLALSAIILVATVMDVPRSGSGGS